MMPLSLQTLSSIYIMNIPKTDLSELSKLIENGKPNAALPCNLSDEVLLQIARDLRIVEISCIFDENIDPPIEGAMLLFLHLMQEQAKELTGTTSFKLNLDSLDHWFQRYMHYVEREIVSRALNIKCQHDNDDLISEIKQEVLFAN